MCVEIYELDPVKCISAPDLAWLAALKKTQVELDLITDIDMLLMIEKDIRGAICNATIMQKLIIITWGSMIKIKNRHTLFIGI